jgi:hypothetical protein
MTRDAKSHTGRASGAGPVGQSATATSAGFGSRGAFVRIGSGFAALASLAVLRPGATAVAGGAAFPTLVLPLAVAFAPAAFRSARVYSVQ